MSPARPKLVVNPDLCDGCGRGPRDCERACKPGALRVGAGCIYVDWDICDGCFECVEVCDAGALSARKTATAAGAPILTVAAASAAAPGRPQPDRRVPMVSGASDEPSASTWTQADALIVLFVMLGSLVALDSVLGLRVVGLMPPSGRVFARVAGLAATYGIEMLAIVALSKRHSIGFASSLGLRPVARTLRSTSVSAGLVLALFVASRALTSIYGLITQSFGWEPTIRWSTDLTRVFGAGWAGLALAILLVAVIGPFVEEVAFRGVVQTALIARVGSIWGIGITALLFGFYHFDWWMFVPTFVLGLALGWLAENRRGLWPPIALHVLYNGLTVVAVFWVAAH